MFEFNVALQCKLDDPDFEIVLVLTASRDELSRAPRWLKAYLAAHLYIQPDDADILTKIRQSLPAPVKEHRQDSDNTDVDCLFVVNPQDDVATVSFSEHTDGDKHDDDNSHDNDIDNDDDSAYDDDVPLLSLE